jgi:quercetin dioxygenase-like cupin family protein
VADAPAARVVLGPHEGDSVALGPLGVRFMVGGADSGGGFALVEHPLAPRSLAAPMHVHEREDEYTYVLEGRVGVQIGDVVRVAGAGDLVFKPRGIWHAFWNPDDAPARMLEIISPAGFEGYFAELPPLLPPRRAEPDVPALRALQARYGLTMDLDSTDRLMAEHALRNV